MDRIRCGRTWHSIAASCVAVLLCAGSPVGATVFPVSNTADLGGGSLRAAVLAANGNAGLDQVVFNPGVTGTITLASTIDITDDLTITGPGPRAITITGSNARRIFNVTAPTTISGLRLANGFTDRGAAINYNASGLLSVSDCHFDQNLATVDGGAIHLVQGSLFVQRCTFTTDQAAGNGGVIFYGQGGGTPSATITNCTFVNNFASNFGGAIRQAGTTAYTAAVTNCTFVVNNAGNGGGAIGLGGGTMSLLNNLFTANGAGGNPGGHLLESGGTFTSLGHNLFGHLDGTTFTPAVSDRFGTVGAQLNTGVTIQFPFDNGGLTDTLPLNATSIAIDAGGTTGAPSTDQRDFPRVGCGPDIGAFEVQTLTDTDLDGVLDCRDTCSGTPTCASVDQTGCPTDSDADGVFDGCDACPNTLAGDAVDSSGCSTADEDADGVKNDADRCRGTPACAIALVNSSGCPPDADGDGIFDGCENCPGSNDLTDTDGDGIPDCLDACPAVGDTDRDGVQDCQDRCLADGLKIAPGACGCGNLDIDTDGDGIPNCLDACPAVGDTDGDGVQDCQDGCPADALKLSPGTCGCGAVDTGIPGARCLCGVVPAACAGQSTPASVGRKSAGACAALASAESVDGQKRRRRLAKADVLLKQASQNATRAARGKRAKLTKECATVLGGTFAEQRALALEAKQAAK